MYRTILSFCTAAVLTTTIGLSGAHGAEVDELVVIAPKAQQHRLMNELLEAYSNETGHDARTFQPNAAWRDWPSLMHRVKDPDAGKGADLLLTTKVDWNYRATEEDRQKLKYVPLALQEATRGGEPVGAIEYGVLHHAEKPSPAVKAFLDYMEGPGGEFLAANPEDESHRHDLFLFHPPDADVTEFQPSDYHNQRPPWKGPFPQLWTGTTHMGNRRYSSTALGEIKKIWMEGYNLAMGTYSTEPFLRFCEERGIVMGQLPPLGSREDYAGRNTPDLDLDEHPLIATFRKARNYPAARGMYAENEDHPPRILIPLYKSYYALPQAQLEEVEGQPHIDGLGEVDKEAKEELQIAIEQFRDWLREKHGDVETINERWDTSYTSIDSIGLPELPLDWVERMMKESGFEYNLLGGNERLSFLYTLFHEPLRYHAYAKFPALLDFKRFIRTVWGRRYKALEEPQKGHETMWKTDFKNRAKDLQPLLTPREGEQVPGVIYTTKTRANPYLFREVPEFNGASFDHPVCKVPPSFSQLMVDSQQIAQSKPVWNSEHHLYNHGSSTPSEVQFHLLHTFLQGLFKSTSYSRETTTVKTEEAPMGREGTREYHKATATKARHWLRTHEDAFRALYEARVDAGIAVMITEGNRGWNQIPRSDVRPEIGGAIQAYGYVGALGKPWKYVLNEDVSAEHVTDTLIVAAPWLTADTLKRINELPATRDVIAVGGVPETNEYGEKLPADQLAELRRRATEIPNWQQLDQAIDPAEGLDAPYTTVHQAPFYWWGRVTGNAPAYLPVPKLEVRHGTADGREFVAVTNFSEEKAVKAPIPWAEGQKVRELTSDDPSPRSYGQSENTAFKPESVNVYELIEE